MQSALSDATGWVAAALAGEERDVGEDVEVAGETADSDDSGARASEQAGGVPGEIVTPEERVVRLVTENGGSMKQGDVVSAVEWSESTVSRKLSKLESDGTITRYQIGREKLVFLPGHEPDSLGSPWREGATDAPGRA